MRAGVASLGYDVGLRYPWRVRFRVMVMAKVRVRVTYLVW